MAANPVFSLWRYSLAWIILVLGWGFAASGSEIILAPIGGPGRIADWFMGSLSLTDFTALWISFAIQGLVYGALVGIVTWLAIKIADTSLPFLTLVGIVFGWMLAWAAGLVAAGACGGVPQRVRRMTG